MRIASLLLTAIASALMACGRSASNEVTIEKIEGGVLTELQKLSSPMVALQFTHRAQGRRNERYLVSCYSWNSTKLASVLFCYY